MAISLCQAPTERWNMDEIGITIAEPHAQDNYRWIDFVQWLSADEKFADKSYSRAIVYTVRDTFYVTFGVHLGKLNNFRNYSVFMLLVSSLRRVNLLLHNDHTL
jgi:hypothetical protein